MDYLGVSRKIESRQERARLKNLIARRKPANAAIIARTACAGVDSKQILADINFLHKLWQDVEGAVGKRRGAGSHPRRGRVCSSEWSATS